MILARSHDFVLVAHDVARLTSQPVDVWHCDGDYIIGPNIEMPVESVQVCTVLPSGEVLT